jgi:hypothetical protein
MIHGRKQYFGLFVLLGFASSSNFQQIVRKTYFLFRRFNINNYCFNLNDFQFNLFIVVL